MKNKKIISKMTALCTALMLGVTGMIAAVSPMSVNAATTLAINKKNFPDENFRSALIKNYDKNKDNKLSSKELKAIKKLVILAYGESSYSEKNFFYGVENLKGLEKLTSLTEVEIYDNSTTKKLDVSKLKSLKVLRIAYCKEISSLNVKGLTSLKTLSVTGCNKIKTLDVTSNSGLTGVSCSGCTSFRTLKTGAKNKKLSGLYVYDQPISKLNVSKLSALKEVNISDTSLSVDKIGIKNKAKITTLNIGNTSSSATINLKKYSNLKYLDARGIGLTSIDLSGNKKLTSLDLNNNNLSEIDLSKQTALETIDISSNSSLKTVDVSAASKINRISAKKGMVVVLPKGEYDYKISHWEYDEASGKGIYKEEEYSVSSVIDTEADMMDTTSVVLTNKQTQKTITLYANNY